MSFILTDLGEEYVMTKDTGAADLSTGLYNDGTDAISDTDDVGAITTEPGGASYARQNTPVSTADLSGDWGFDNDNQEQWDTSDSSQSVDGYFLVANFASVDAGDGGTATNHLIATGALSQTRDLTDIDTLKISAGGIGVTVD
jgi:hypothetical protein